MSMGVSVGVSVGVSAGAAVDVSVGLSVDKPVGLSVVPRLAVEMAVEIVVELAVELAVEIAMASATGLHGVPRHSVEAHGMPVECPQLSVERRGNSREMSWRSADTAAVLRQKDKECTSLHKKRDDCRQLRYGCVFVCS